jgi:hypothetical protein
MRLSVRWLLEATQCRAALNLSVTSQAVVIGDDRQLARLLQATILLTHQTCRRRMDCPGRVRKIILRLPLRLPPSPPLLLEFHTEGIKTATLDQTIVAVLFSNPNPFPTGLIVKRLSNKFSVSFKRQRVQITILIFIQMSFNYVDLKELSNNS